MSASITYRCSNCQATVTQPLEQSTRQLHCPSCESAVELIAGLDENGRLERCVVCPCQELFIRKDFPQRLGVSIVVLGLGLSCVTWLYHMLIGTFAILFATALIDVALYVMMGDLIECYGCHAQYRGTSDLDQTEAFDLEIHERYRQTAARKAQLASQNANRN